MADYSLEALGSVIRDLRLKQVPPMSQEQLATLAGYQGGGAVSISRIERGLVSPRAGRLAGIALALSATPEQLQQAAARETTRKVRVPGPTRLKEQVADTKRRHARVSEKVSERSATTEDLVRNFNDVHDKARDEFFMRFVETAEGISGAPTAKTADDEVAQQDRPAAEIRVEAMSNGIAAAIGGAAAGSVTGAAIGGAAAYGAFTAAAMFGTASTGAAISGLSGVAATNATLAVLGGGTLAAGGAGMAGGTLLLTGMVAAPVAALAAAGFLVLKQRRTKREEERLRDQVTRAEKALSQSQDGFDAMVDVLQRATYTIEYVSIHGTHALAKWKQSLPPEPRAWEDIEGTDEGRRYNDFLTLAGCLLAVSSINLGALLTADQKALAEMTSAIEETLDYADKTIKELV